MVFFKQCYIPDSIAGKKPAFYDVGTTVIVYGNQVEKNKIELGLTNMSEVVKNIHSIELDVVTDDKCP